MFGLAIGVIAGYYRIADLIVMRIMDGVMAIPGIVLAVALVAISGASLTTVLVAIAVPEIPRVVRLVRGVILSLRSEPYVEAAISLEILPRFFSLFGTLIPNTGGSADRPEALSCSHRPSSHEGRAQLPRRRLAT